MNGVARRAQDPADGKENIANGPTCNCFFNQPKLVRGTTKWMRLDTPLLFLLFAGVRGGHPDGPGGSRALERQRPWVSGPKDRQSVYPIK